MYPSEATLTEELNKLIEEGKPLQKDMIHQYIQEFDTSKFDEGERYYYKQNDIKDRVIYKYDNSGNKVVDTDATNNKYKSGKHKLMVDQKSGYLVKHQITIGSKDEQDISPIIDLVGEEFHDTMPELVIGASNKGVEWLHPYIDRNGEFDYLIVPAQEVIPIYDNTKRKNLIAAIRFYDLDHDDITKVEYWTEKDVTLYEIIDGEIFLDTSVEVNPQGHFEYGTDTQGYNRYGWNRVPFIPFKNNEKEVSDLQWYKDFIDIYDNLMSDGANTLEDIQEFIYLLKGYTDSDWQEVLTNIKRYKGAKVDGDGGLDILQGEMPIDSLDRYLDRVIDDLYHDGQGVNLATDKFGNSPSGIALKFLFSGLDSKANVMERKFVKSLKQFFWFVCEYASITGLGQFDYNQLTFTFNKSMLMNDAEQVAMAQQSVGVISKETIMANHPWVTDIEMEKERLEDEAPDINLDQPLGEDNE